jgi:outer membrane immunogenic protein
MKRLFGFVLAGATVLAVSAVPAFADPAGSWNGAYVGAFAGYASGSSAFATSVDCTVNGVLCDPYPHYLNNGELIGDTASGKASSGGFSGGALAGLNWQNGAVVYGLEADVGSLPLHASVGGTADTLNLGLYNGSDPSVFTVSASAATDWMATARVRAGFLPVPGLLLYGTAGIAVTELTVSNAYADNFNNSVGTGNAESASSAEFRTALVVGAGAEWAMAAHWKLRAEYLHADFGPLSTTGISTYLPEVTDSNPITSTGSLSADVVRVGLAYGF